MPVKVETLTGEWRRDALSALARLRITVFRDWPYLYDGTIENEQEYLAQFSAAEDATIVAAYDGDEIVGAATAAPLDSHTEEFVPLFERHGFDPARIFYFGESVLLPSYRGQGIGHAFFDQREAQAKAATGPSGPYSHTAFCGVVRPADHSARPAEYRALDEFWKKRGYAPVDGMIGSYTWKDIGESAETSKPMQFWAREL